MYMRMRELEEMDTWDSIWTGGRTRARSAVKQLNHLLHKTFVRLADKQLNHLLQNMCYRSAD